MNKWTVVSPIETKRAGAGVVALNEYLYAIGKETL